MLENLNYKKEFRSLLSSFCLVKAHLCFSASFFFFLSLNTQNFLCYSSNFNIYTFFCCSSNNRRDKKSSSIDESLY